MTTKSIIFFDKDPLPSSIPDTVMYLKKWLITTIVYKQELPLSFIRCQAQNILNKEKTTIVLNSLTYFLTSHFFQISYPRSYSFQKIYLEDALEKQKEAGYFTEIKKLPGSQYYFGKSKEELYSPVLEGFDTLIINNIEIEGYPKDTIIFIDRYPEVKPFYTAQKRVFEELREAFEKIYKIAVKEGDIKAMEIAEKELFFQAWVSDFRGDEAYINKTLGELYKTD